MAVNLISVNNIENIHIAKYIADTEAEKDNIPDEDRVQGTEVLVIEGNKRYRLDCNLQWVEIVSQGSGGGGGGGPSVTIEPISITQNGQTIAPYGKAYSPVNVNVENTYVAADEGKVVSNGGLVAQAAHSTITQNGTYDTTLNDSVEIDVPQNPSVEVLENDVIFIDYDGTILYSYTAEEFEELNELPSNPVHEGLIAQGWNWTLSDAKDYVDIYGALIIGQNYNTSDGSTRIYVDLDERTLEPTLNFGLDGTATINWGDNSEETILTGENINVCVSATHTYQSIGKYKITISYDGTIAFYGTDDDSETTVGSFMFVKNSVANGRNADTRDHFYQRAIYKIELGEYTELKYWGLAKLENLFSITIPISLTSFEDGILYRTESLKGVVFPDGLTSIKSKTFWNSNIIYISLPKTISMIKSSAFQDCYNIKRITISNSLTSYEMSAFLDAWNLEEYIGPIKGTSIDPSVLPQELFQNCCNLRNIEIPTTTITTISSLAFSWCMSLISIIIPSNITQINSKAFSVCTNLREIHFKSAAPPLITASDVWSGLDGNCIIYVPTGRRSTYISATNYPNPSIYTYVEEA